MDIVTGTDLATSNMDWFEKLYKDRWDWDEVTNRNKFGNGIKQSIVDKYPDPVHFIYELLQNADDQNAVKVGFIVNRTKLIFWHNGTAFSREDVENITGIGNTYKPDEPNKIGRFGIGFKSVFVITERPEIYTNIDNIPFAFAIEKLVLPVKLAETNIIDLRIFNSDNLPAEPITCFVFPFKQAEAVPFYRAICEKLRNLGSDILLFLHHLTQINWEIFDEIGRYRCENRTEDIRYFYSEIETEKNIWKNREQRVAYLVYTQEVQLEEADRKLPIFAAFKLNNNNGIEPDRGHPLDVFFPTQEKIGLKFRLHAPFILTDNRANVKKGNESNKKLIAEAAKLLGTILPDLKTRYLLDINALNTMPIEEDLFPETSEYRPLFVRVKAVLQKEELLPANKPGKFIAPLNARLARGSGLRDLLSDNQLTDLYESANPLFWISGSITENSTTTTTLYSYIEQLGVPEVKMEFFYRKLTSNFLAKQPDEWMIRLYKMLPKNERKNLIDKPIIRTKRGRQIIPFGSDNKTPQVYLPPKVEIDSRKEIVKPSLLQDQDVLEFTHWLGLRELSKVEVTSEMLLQFSSGRVAYNPSNYKGTLQYFEKALKEAADQKQYDDLLAELKQTPFIRAFCANDEARTVWKKPEEVYIKTAQLQIWFENNPNAWFADPIFNETVSPDFRKKIGVAEAIRVHKKAADKDGWVNLGRSKEYKYARGKDRFDRDAKIDGLEFVLNNITIDRACILWNDLLSKQNRLIYGTVEESNRQDFHSASTKQFPSTYSYVGRLCMEKAWLPDTKKNNQFSKPNQISIDNLPEQFDHNSTWIADKLGMIRVSLSQAAQDLGLTTEELQMFKTHKDKIREFLSSLVNDFSEAPDEPVKNPERRKEKAAEQAAESREKEYQPRIYYRRVSAPRSAEKKAYLKEHNMGKNNDNSSVICQLCHVPMPFKHNGEDFFEAYQFIESVGKEYQANNLALCPNCAAEYSVACEMKDEELITRLFSVSHDMDREFRHVILDTPVHKRLYFSSKHLMDLQEAIRHEKDNNPKYH